jgi:hypothetical protein
VTSFYVSFSLYVACGYNLPHHFIDNTVYSDEELARVKDVVEKYREGKQVNLSDEEIWVSSNPLMVFSQSDGQRLFCLGC